MRHALIENQTDDVTTEFVAFAPGEYQLGLRGTFDGATVKLLFSDDCENALPDLADFTWAAAPEPFLFTIKEGVGIAVDVSGAGATTDLTLAVNGDSK